MKIRIILFLSFFPLVAYADNELVAEMNVSAEESLLWDENESIYLATRYVKRLDQSPSTATVITEKEIRNMGARNIYDVLKRVPGMAVTINAFYGIKGLEMRGIRTEQSEKILLLLDGQELNGPLRGAFTFVFDNIPLTSIKRIEVIRGPASALYGANAFAGVISIITHSGSEFYRSEIAVGAGSYNTKELNAQTKWSFGKAKASLFLHRSETDGPSLFIAKDVVGDSGYTRLAERQSWAGLGVDYGYWQFNGKFLDRTRDDYIGVAGALNDESMIGDTAYLAQARYRRDLDKNSTISGRLHYGYDDSLKHWEIFSEGVFAGYPADQSMFGHPDSVAIWSGAEVQYDVTPIEGSVITLGLNIEHRRMKDVTNKANFSALDYSYDPPFRDKTNTENWLENNVSEDLYSAYVQNVRALTKEVELTVGVRHDRNDAYGSATSPRFAVVWDASKKVTTRLLYGEAFRAPAFAERYITNNPVVEGNKNLMPETIKTTEAAMRFQPSRGVSFETTLFRNQIADLIRTVPIEGSDKRQYQNVDSVRVIGIEAELRWSIDTEKYTYINVTYQDGRNETVDKPLADIAEYKGNVGLNWDLASSLIVNGNLSIQGDKKRGADDARVKDLKGHYLMDVALLYRPSTPSFELKLMVFNLLNDTYQDPSPPSLVNASDFPLPGRHYFAEVGYSF